VRGFKARVTLIVTTMDDLIRNLTRLGLTDYEARVYAALVGMGEGTARQIHLAGGVPRPRVYDIAEGLAARGFIAIRQVSPAYTFRPTRPLSSAASRAISMRRQRPRCRGSRPSRLTPGRRTLLSGTFRGSGGSAVTWSRSLPASPATLRSSAWTTVRSGSSPARSQMSRATTR